MSGSSYRKFVEILKAWPVDQTKIGGRDLGEYIRHRLSTTFRLGAATSVDEEKCGFIASSLLRISKDKYKEEYPRLYSSSSLGLTQEECKGLLSNEFLAQMRYESKPFYEKLVPHKNKK